jgi:superfamily I DNA and/or RNA helicase
MQHVVDFAGDLNQEQRQAVTRALSAPDFTVILGPPGTGKTAVIVETLVQLAREGKRALAVSVTNTAVDNIVERLLDLGHRFEIRFGNWYKIRERAMEVALINLVTNEEDRALAAVERMRTAAAVLTTCSSASLDLVKAGRFDVVLFEESSQIRMQDAFSALVQAHKAVVIGDDKQLPPVSHMNRRVSSLLEIAIDTLNRHGRNDDLMTRLRVQYRMQRQICDLINHTFYDGSLESASSLTTRPQVPPQSRATGIPQLDRALDPAVPIAVLDVEGVEEHRGYSVLNRANLKVDSLLIDSLGSAGLASNQIGVITPYAEQQRMLSASIGQSADIGTVDSFQGQERDVVVLDLVRANPMREVGFTLDPSRLNVALSRARQKLIVVANLSTFQRHAQFDEVVNHMRSLPGTVIEHVTAEEICVQLPEYTARREIQLNPGMVDELSEPEEQPPAEPIAPAGNYLDIY